MSAALHADLVVLGGGSGGLAAAFRAAEYGAKVALLEPGELGGTCVNVGCVPKKAMWLAADLAAKIDLAARLGFALYADAQRLDWREFLVHRQRYVANIHASYRRRLDQAGIVLHVARGRLRSRDTVVCDDGVLLRAPQILIATGGHPWRPPIPGAELGIDSDGFFALDAAPERVALIGGGYIAVELAGLLQALGSRVDVLVRGERLLDGFEIDLVQQLADDMHQYGTRLHFGAQVEALHRDGEALALRGSGGIDTQARYDRVIFATGRRPNTRGLGLDAVGVACDARGHVVVDAFQRTGVDGIHAVGDVTDQLALTPVAIAAARRLMDRLFGGQREARLDLSDVPSVVFAHPLLAKLGLTEAQARLRYGDAEVRAYRAKFRPMLHALADTPQCSLFKLVCVGAAQRVVGVHLLGEGADEILQGFAVALKRGATLADFQATVAIHPTSAEEVVLMR